MSAQAHSSSLLIMTIYSECCPDFYPLTTSSCTKFLFFYLIRVVRFYSGRTNIIRRLTTATQSMLHTRATVVLLSTLSIPSEPPHVSASHHARSTPTLRKRIECKTLS
jgi:hypothetical protein